MHELVASVFVAALAAILLLRHSRDYGRDKQSVIWIGFTAHLFAALAQVWVTWSYYGGGDMVAYFDTGAQLAHYASRDMGLYLPRILALIFQQEVSLPIFVVGAGGSTGTMSGFAALAILLTGGSAIASCAIFGLWAFTGQLAIYRVFREVFPRQFHKRMLIACILLPSVVFWTSGIMKEAIAFGGLGWALLGLRRALFTGPRLRGALMVAVGGIAMALTKPYILFALVLAAGVWLYWYKSTTSHSETAALTRPLYLVVALALAGGALTWLGEEYPRYSLDNVTEETANLQKTYYRIEGGSTYQLGGDTKTSSSEQIALAPLAFTTALFRPFIFEAHNAAALVNALETLVLTILLIVALVRRGVRNSIALINRSPFAMFCVAFVVLFGIAVGLGAPNLGSLSRYRVPMMPFYAGLILLILPLRKAPGGPDPSPRRARFRAS